MLNRLVFVTGIVVLMAGQAAAEAVPYRYTEHREPCEDYGKAEAALLRSPASNPPAFPSPLAST